MYYDTTKFFCDMLQMYPRFKKECLDPIDHYRLKFFQSSHDYSSSGFLAVVKTKNGILIYSDSGWEGTSDFKFSFKLITLSQMLQLKESEVMYCFDEFDYWRKTHYKHILGE